MVKQCDICDKNFYVRPGQVKKRFCCSTKCGYERLTKYKYGNSVEREDSVGETKKQKMGDYRRRLRKAVLDALGGVCVKCDYDDSRALQIDHIDGGGKEERKSIPNTWKFYQVVIDSFQKEENKYQLLCANCNQIKRIVNKEHRKSWQ